MDRLTDKVTDAVRGRSRSRKSASPDRSDAAVVPAASIAATPGPTAASPAGDQPGGTPEVPLALQIARLRKRVKELEGAPARTDTVARLNRVEGEIQELRGLGGRVAELADLVTELLISAARREDPEFRQIIDKYLGEV